MNYEPRAWAQSDALVEIVDRTLVDAGYRVSREGVPEFRQPPTVAEDAYLIAAFVTAGTWREVAPDVPGMQIAFGNWAVRRDPSKRWDLYLVMLVSSEISAEDVADIEEVVSDIRYVRKIVRGNVFPTRESVENALAPFLPVSSLLRVEADDPLRALERELREQGIDPALVAMAVESFQKTGSVKLP